MIDDIEQKLRKLLRLGLHPATGADEAAEALHRAKHIAERHQLDLTRLLDSAASRVFESHPPAPDSHAASDAPVGSYLETMTRILDRATMLAQELTDTQAHATGDPRLFSDPLWITALERVVDQMDAISSDVRAVSPPASLIHIHVLYMRIAVAYQIRIRDLRTVIACLRRLDLSGASAAFGDVARVGELIASMGAELEAALAQEV